MTCECVRQSKWFILKEEDEKTLNLEFAVGKRYKFEIEEDPHWGKHYCVFLDRDVSIGFGESEQSAYMFKDYFKILG